MAEERVDDYTTPVPTEQAEAGASLRSTVPRTSHGEWQPAADLTSTATTGIQAQLCGDAHLSNFGVFASPERRLMFDLDDFDETLPGPWEWDLKRLAASFTIAARSIGLGKREDSEAAQACAETHRTTMAEFAGISAPASPATSGSPTPSIGQSRSSRGDTPNRTTPTSPPTPKRSLTVRYLRPSVFDGRPAGDNGN